MYCVVLVCSDKQISPWRLKGDSSFKCLTCSSAEQRHAFISRSAGSMFLTSLICHCRERWHTESVEPARTNVPVTSEQWRSWMLSGWSGRGSQCVSLRIIFRARYQQRPHENKPVAATEFSHNTASRKDTKRIVRQQQGSFHLDLPAVCSERGLKQLERNHPAVTLEPRRN